MGRIGSALRAAGLTLGSWWRVPDAARDASSKDGAKKKVEEKASECSEVVVGEGEVEGASHKAFVEDDCFSGRHVYEAPGCVSSLYPAQWLRHTAVVSCTTMSTSA